MNVEREPVQGATHVISWFTFRRMVLGATIFGVFAAVESVAQSLGIVASFPNAAERTTFIQSLASNAALGLFYGDSHADIASPGGYMVYRILPILSLVGAIWALMFTTKMLRGQEENGRWELLLAGQTSAQKATAKTIVGASGGIAVAYVFVALLTISIGHTHTLMLSPGSCAFYSLTLIAGAAVAVGIGSVTSQFAATRRRAVLYGMGPVLLFFALRSIGNIVSSLAWIKNLTPFGWIDKLHPFYHPQPMWLLPLALSAVVCAGSAIWLSGKRDMASSFIADNDSAKPKLGLLRSQLGFDFRSTRSALASWLFASVALSALIAAIDKTVANSISSVGSVSRSISKLTGNPYAHIEVAYLSAAAYFTVTILMIMVTSSLSAAREEESSSRLDNFVGGTVGRHRWLGARLLLIVFGALVISMLSSMIVWVLAEAQDIHVSFTTLVFGGLNILGPVIFLLGFGVLVYGIKPRFATIAMYVLIAWSFTIDIVAAVLKTSTYVADTSLLHHISLVPAANPHWESFWVLSVSGFALMSLGVLAFQRRDLEVE